jgi:DNA-binding NarL/FixJ family response regulator
MPAPAGILAHIASAWRARYAQTSMRVLLADDHTLVRAGIRGLVEAIPEVEIVAEAGDGHEALALILDKRPDVALVDVSMPGLNGIDLAARVAREAPQTRVAILSMHGTPGHVVQALRAGVKGYVLKDAAAEELPLLLRAVMRGETYLSSAISKHVVDAYLDRDAKGKAPEEGAPLDGLTPRQREILQLVAEGKSTKDVARLLNLSVKTVEAHRGQIMTRLEIHDLAGLVRYAIRTGLVSPER